MSQLIAIVGRPNVGKSTLFNRLTQTRTAITNDEAGTTRDRQYGKVEWVGKEFSIVDTGGWVIGSEDVFESEINKQVQVAIEQADEILFVVDATNGVTDLDDQVAEILRRSSKPVILVANKVDAGESLYNIAEFYSLGLGDPYGVSAVSGYGTGDLLDEVVAKMPEKDNDESDILDDIPKICIVGRPNAVIACQLIYGTRASHSHRHRRDHTRLHIHKIQQIRIRFLPRRHRRHTQEKQSQRRHRILLCDPFHQGYRSLRCMPAHDRRHTRHRSTGRLDILAHTT